MPNLADSASGLDGALKAARSSWEAAQSVWNDPVSRSFDKDCWSPLEAQVLATAREMARLAQVIAEARRQLK